MLRWGEVSHLSNWLCWMPISFKMMCCPVSTCVSTHFAVSCSRCPTASVCWLILFYAFKALADAVRCDVAASDAFGHAINGRVAELEALLASGSVADVDEVFSHTGTTLLIASLLARRPRIATLLLAYGADPRVTGSVSERCNEARLVT